MLALVLLVQGTRRLLLTITAFTAAHSLTLAGATLGWVHVPGPPVEASIALSIVFVASEIIHARQGRYSVTQHYPWVVAFTFGLLHGFGFAGALAEVGLPQSSIPIALLFFNVGVEIGQLLFVGAVLAVIAVGWRAGQRLRLSQTRLALAHRAVCHWWPRELLAGRTSRRVLTSARLPVVVRARPGGLHTLHELRSSSSLSLVNEVCSTRPLPAKGLSPSSTLSGVDLRTSTKSAALPGVRVAPKSFMN